MLHEEHKHTKRYETQTSPSRVPGVVHVVTNTYITMHDSILECLTAMRVYFL